MGLFTPPSLSHAFLLGSCASTFRRTNSRDFVAWTRLAAQAYSFELYLSSSVIPPTTHCPLRLSAQPLRTPLGWIETRMRWQLRSYLSPCCILFLPTDCRRVSLCSRGTSSRIRPHRLVSAP